MNADLTFFCGRESFMTMQTVYARLVAFALALLIAVPAPLWAQDPEAQAADYYNQATLAYQKGDYQAAADLLDLAFGTKPDLVYKYNRILALQALGDYETALADLNAMYGPMKADAEKRFEDIDQIKEQLEASLAARQGDDTTDPNGSSDANLSGTAPKKDPPNYLAFGLIGGGGILMITGTLFATAALLPKAAKECLGIGSDTDCRNWRERQGFVATTSDDDVQEDAKSVQTTHQVASIALLGVGAIAAGVGVFLLVTDGKKKKGGATTMIAPYVAGDGGGAVLQMRF